MDDEVCRGRAAEWWTCVVGETCFFDDECCGCGAENEKDLEEAMRAGLQSYDWSKVAVGFATANTIFPVAHNRLVALRREGWRQKVSRAERMTLGVCMCVCMDIVTELTNVI